jgi:hypothetical protein
MSVLMSNFCSFGADHFFAVGELAKEVQRV